MRFAGLLLAALLVSSLAGAGVGAGLADWADGDESYVLVFLAVAVAVVVSLFLFLLATTRVEPKRAMRRVAMCLGGLVIVLLAIHTLAALVLDFGSSLSWRSIKLGVAMGGSMLAVIAAQWAVLVVGAIDTRRWGRGPGATA